MKPYFEDARAGITVYHGDCREVLPTLGDASVDHVIMDPPYSEHVHGKVRRGGSLPDAVDGPAACYSRATTLGFESLADDVRAFVAAQIVRTTKRWALAFADAESVHLWQRGLAAAGFDHCRIGAWVKIGATPQFTGDRPATGFEAIEIAHAPGRKRWNGGGTHAVWSVPIVLDRGGTGGVEPRVHTTQKPLALMSKLVSLFTDPGDLVLDPFAGSGTTGRACKDLGRRCIMVEREEKYCEVIVRRLAQETLFGVDLTARQSGERR